MYTCSLCGRTGTPEGNKEMDLEKLGPLQLISVQLKLNKDKFAERHFDLCKDCAKEMNVKSMDKFIIDKDHKLTFEEMIKGEK